MPEKLSLKISRNCLNRTAPELSETAADLRHLRPILIQMGVATVIAFMVQVVILVFRIEVMVTAMAEMKDTMLHK